MNDGQTDTDHARTAHENDAPDAARASSDGDDDAIEVELPSRDLESEVGDGRAGKRGILVEAICTGCKLTRSKRTARADPDKDSDKPASFKHVCHSCRKVKWWTAIRRLETGGDR